MAGCGAVSPSSPAPAAVQITSAAACPDDPVQDLTFTGGLAGHIGCSPAPACHRIHGPQSPGVKVQLFAKAGGRPVFLLIAFGSDHLGSFTATPIGDAPNLDQQGVTLTGVGTWSTPANGGTLTVLVEEDPTLDKQGRVSGSMDVRLTSGASSAELNGSWTCYKTLDGGDGWSSA